MGLMVDQKAQKEKTMCEFIKMSRGTVHIGTEGRQGHQWMLPGILCPSVRVSWVMGDMHKVLRDKSRIRQAPVAGEVQEKHSII